MSVRTVRFEIPMLGYPWGSVVTVDDTVPLVAALIAAGKMTPYTPPVGSPHVIDGNSLVRVGDLQDSSSDASAALRAAFVSTTAPARLVPGARFLYEGDSITFGSGATFGQHYPYRMSALLGSVGMAPLPGVGNAAAAAPPAAYLSVNQGIAGQTSTQIVGRLASDIAAAGRVDGVTLLAGTNDVKGAAAGLVATWQGNIKQAAAICRQLGIPLAVGTIPPLRGTSQTTAARQRIFAMNLWLQQWGPRNGVQIAHVFRALADPTTGDMLAAYDSGDGTHPNNAGHLLIATAFATALTPILPSPVGVLSTKGAGIVSNPLMTGGSGTTLPSGWSELTTNSAGTSVYSSQAQSGSLVAGQWLQMDLDGTAAACLRVVSTNTFTLSPNLTPGGLAMIVAQVEVTDVAGYAASAAAGNSFWAVTAGDSGGTTQYATAPGVGVVTAGPIFVPFLVPSGVTSTLLKFSAKADTGVHAKFRLGCADIIDLSSLGGIDLTV